MANFSAPAHNAAIGNLAGMMVVPTAGVGLAMAIGDALSAARDARYEYAYGDALGNATEHAHRMENIARVSIDIVAKLEAQVKSLRAACEQRQEVIDILKCGP